MTYQDKNNVLQLRTSRIRCLETIPQTRHYATTGLKRNACKRIGYKDRCLVVSWSPSKGEETCWWTVPTHSNSISDSRLVSSPLPDVYKFLHNSQGNPLEFYPTYRLTIFPITQNMLVRMEFSEWEPRNVHASPSKNRLVHDFTFPVISQTQNIPVWKLSRCRVLQERKVPHLASTRFMDPEISLPPFTTARHWSLSRARQINFTSPVLTSTKIRFNYPQT